MSTPPPSLADLLEESFGEDPPPRPAADALSSGHRALRRRRTTTGAAAVTAVAAIALTAALVGGGSPTTATEIAPADRPSPTPTAPESPTSDEPASPPRPSGRQDVALLPSGILAKARGVRVTERIPNPLGYAAPDRSLGIAYERDGETTWALLTFQLNADGLSSTSGVASDPAGRSFATLQQWIDDQVALQNGEEAPLQFVRFIDAGSETLTPLEGVEILQQRPGIDLGAGFAGPDDPTAVAEVRIDGERWYVLARTLPGSPPQYLPTAAEIGGATLADFLDFAAERYAEGGGGLR